MIGMIDESIVDTGTGCVYILALVLVDAPENVVRDRLRTVTEGRGRAFHWSQEGPLVRGRMGAVAWNLPIASFAFAAACGRARQDSTRDILMHDALETAALSQVSTLHIESRGRHLDVRDRRVAQQVFAHARDLMPALTWQGKNEPLTWIADALAGAMYEILLRPQGEKGAETVRHACRCHGLTWHVNR